MPIRYIPFEPQVLQGQAILSNFARTRRVLRYRDNDAVFRTLDRGMPLYEASLQEQVGDAGGNPLQGAGGLLLRGECLSACAYLKDQGIKVDLVYIDPPFASGADYAKKIYLRRNPKLAEALAAAEQQLEDEELRSFEENMYGDIWNKEQYLNWMYENLLAIKSIMSDTASIYVHLDWHIGHYVKVLMDEVFGEQNFINEIVWKRTSGHSDAGRFGNSHDVIFYYSKNENLIWNQVYQEYDADYVKQYYRYKDEDGRNWMSGDLGAEGLQGSGYDYLWKGVRRIWRVPQKTMERLDKEGKIFYTKNGIPRIKRYFDESQGLPAQDIWADVESIRSWHKEKADYATQKPEALLERVLKASSNEGMVVADFFGGSGVTAAVAHKLGRRFVHADVGINSIQTTRDRLKAAGAAFSILEIEDGVSLYRNPNQTMQLLKTRILNLRNEDPLPQFFEGEVADSKYGAIPVYLPNLQDHTSRLLNKYWLSRIINEAMSELDNTKYKRVRLYYVDIEDEKDLHGFIRENNMTGIEIELADLKPLLAESVMEEEVVTRLEGNDTEGYRLWVDAYHSDRLKERISRYNDRGLAQNTKLFTDDEEEHDATDTIAQSNRIGDDETDEATEKPKRKKAFQPIEISDNGLELIEMVSLDCTSASGPWHSDAEVKIDKTGFVIKNGVKTKEYWDGSIMFAKRPLRVKVRNVGGDEVVNSTNN